MLSWILCYKLASSVQNIYPLLERCTDAEKKTSMMGRIDLATASSSPIVNIKQTQNATIMTAFRDVAKIIAVGTRFRGFAVSSTVGGVSTSPKT